RASWRAVEVPVVLISAQLLILAWLLLFLLVADAAEARGPEVALAKMRGRGLGDHRWPRAHPAPARHSGRAARHRLAGGGGGYGRRPDRGGGRGPADA